MKKIILSGLICLTTLSSMAQALSPQGRNAMKIISSTLPRMFIKPEYTQTIPIGQYNQVKIEWDAYMVDHNDAVGAWNKIPKSDQSHKDVQAIRNPLSERITFFQQWSTQMKATEKLMGANRPVSNNAGTPVTEKTQEKLTAIAPLLAAIEIKNEFSGIFTPDKYVPAAEWYLKNKDKYSKTVALLNLIPKGERTHPDAMAAEKKILEIQKLLINVQNQLKPVSSSQRTIGLFRKWQEETEKYKGAVLIFADVLGLDLKQNTTSTTALYQLSPDNYDKTMKDLDALAVLMNGSYKELIDDFSDVFRTLETSPLVSRLVSVNRKTLLPAVVKLSAKRFMGNAMSSAPDINDLENDEGWMDGTMSPSESKKKLAQVKSWFIPVLQKSGISETEAGLNGLDSIYKDFWRKAEELAPKWSFPSDANAAGDARAKTLFTNELKAAFPGVQIIKLGFAYDAKWTLYIDQNNQPRYRTIGTTALIKVPGEKFYTAWRLLFNENFVSTGKFSGGEIQWMEWRWQENK